MERISRFIIEIIIGLIGSIIVASFFNFLEPAKDYIDVIFRTHPIFWGVIISWFFAVISTGTILLFAYFNRNMSDQYEIILRESERYLMMVSMAVIFYISINLASETLTGKGIPILSDPYKIGVLSVSPQDLFLISLALIIIVLVFFVAPRFKLSKKVIILILFVLIFSISFLFNSISKSEVIPHPEDDLLKYEQENREHRNRFLLSTVIGILFFIIIWWKKPKDVEGSDLKDLGIYFSIIPAFVVASLALNRHPFVTYDNLTGHAVVGILIISGFVTLVILTMISLKNPVKATWIWGFATVGSLIAISSFSSLFLLLEPIIHDINLFRNILMFSIAVILVILQYGFAYEKLFKYRFTEWWRIKFRPMAMIISILIILFIGSIDNELKPWGIPVKLIGIVLALILVIFLPWILGIVMFWKDMKLKWFKLPGIPLPKYQGMVMVKAEMSQANLKNIVEELDKMKGVYQTMVVMGEYDVCLIVEGENHDKIADKILEIRKIKGVARTITLTDIRESFDKVGS